MSTTIAFDMLKFTKRLTQAGASPELAEATAEACKEAFGGAEVATKSDIRDLKHEFDLLSNELKLHRWILAIIAAGVVLPVIRDFV